ncbi:MAG TPA: hypothetical protein VM577_06895 [Anaerovoracaceae bacterium]|nr:hypothetical protein [Anaerovoracaceae bacterium]
MLIDGLVIGASISMFVARLLTNQWGEATIWAIIGVYALFNFMDRQLVGSKYDY